MLLCDIILFYPYILHILLRIAIFFFLSHSVVGRVLHAYKITDLMTTLYNVICIIVFSLLFTINLNFLLTYI